MFTFRGAMVKPLFRVRVGLVLGVTVRLRITVRVTVMVRAGLGPWG